MVHQIHKLFEQLKLIPGQKMEVQKLLFSFIGRNSMHLVWFPCISCMEFRPPWSDFHTPAWKSDSSIPAWCGSVAAVVDFKIWLAREHFFIVGTEQGRGPKSPCKFSWRPKWLIFLISLAWRHWFSPLSWWCSSGWRPPWTRRAPPPPRWSCPLILGDHVH